MEKLRTNYLGLELKSPVILGSSGLSKKIDNLIVAEQSGIGAIVLESVFEEQISYEANKTFLQSLDYPEAQDYISNYLKHDVLDNYIKLIKTAKSNVKIPVIASINCVSDDKWEDFVKKIEDAGADALELNINVPNFDADTPAAKIEEQYYKIVEHVSSKTKLRFAVKISRNFTNIAYVVKNLHFRGVNSFVLFNRFFEPVIDINTMEMKASSALSYENDLKHTLRWVAIVSGQVPNIEISASTGIHNADGVIQQILAGAKTVQLCSVLYKKGVKEAGVIVKGIEEWMDKNKFSNIDQFRGKLSYKNIEDPKIYERFQFIKHISNIE